MNKHKTMQTLTFILIFLICMVLNFAQQPSITVTSPNSNSKWTRGEAYPIKWTTTGQIIGVWITLHQSTGSEVVADITGKYILNEYLLGWRIPKDIAPGDYRIRVSSGSIFDYSDVFKIQVKAIKPKLPSKIATSLTTTSGAFTSPQKGKKYRTGSALPIRWNRTLISADEIKIQYCKLRPIVINRVIIGSTNNDGFFNWKIPSTIDPGDYVVLVIKPNALIYIVSEEFQIIKPLVIKR